MAVLGVSRESLGVSWGRFWGVRAAKRYQHDAKMDDGKRVSAKTVASILCLSVAIRGLVRKGETERMHAPR